MENSELEKMINQTFPEMQVILITKDQKTGMFGVSAFGCDPVDRVGMIECARIQSRIQFSRFETNQALDNLPEVKQ